MSDSVSSILSGRAQIRLQQLQRDLAIEHRGLAAKQSLLIGALQACDVSTQAGLLREYIEQVNTLMEAVLRLRGFIVRHADAGDQSMVVSE